MELERRSDLVGGFCYFVFCFVGYKLDLVERWICGFVVVVCMRICGGQWIVVCGRLLWLGENVVADELLLLFY